MSNKAYKNMLRIFKAYINEHIFEMRDKWHWGTNTALRGAQTLLHNTALNGASIAY